MDDKGWEFSEVERQDGNPSPVFASSCHHQQKSSDRQGLEESFVTWRKSMLKR